jgi:ketosteroid isomerase-like protein
MTWEVIDFTRPSVSGCKSYLARVALHLTVQDALIIRHHVYEDSLAVARAWSGT